MIDFEAAPGPSEPVKGRWGGRSFAASSGSASAGPASSVPARAPLSPEDPALPTFLKRLNPSQREAALATEGPLLVLAGAGSGKTQMLISRVAYLISHLGVPANRILAVTFTNKAAREMQERITRILGELNASHLYVQPEIGTFHAVCVKILRNELDRTGFTKPFVIYDDSDQLTLVKNVMAKLNIDPKAVNPKAIQALINGAKCDAVEPQDYQPSPFSFVEKQFARVYPEYQKALIANNAVDFGEIITMAYRLLRDHADVRDKYQKRYRYLHVDEYQDTNRAQYLLLRQLVPVGAGPDNICVVGDEDQSIYKWRGADIRNILDFEKDYPGARIVKLEQNYRSTKSIITAAGEVIRNNTQRKDKTLWTDNAEGELVMHHRFQDERSEAEHVVSTIKRFVTEEARSLDDFAILYRTHAQSRQFEDLFRREKIPYQVVGGTRFYDRKEIKDVISYFRVILNPADSVGLERIINTPARGIGKTTMDKLQEELAREFRKSEELVRQSTSDAEGAAGDLWSLLQSAAAGEVGLAPRAASKLGSFVDLMQRLMTEQPKLMLSELYHLILDETGYVRELRKEGTVEAQARIENLEEFDTLLQEFEEEALAAVPEAEREALKPKLLERFIEQSTLASESDKEFEPATVKLMTLHGSKGLEFPIVFIPGMEEGLFPSIKVWEEVPPEDIEEERRLCYVGMTRARERLFLSSVVARRLWGQVLFNEPARFLSEISVEHMESRDLSYGKSHDAFAHRPKFERAQAHDSGTGLGSSGFEYGGARSGAGSRPGHSSRDEYSQDYGDGGYASEALTAADLIGRKLKHPSYGLGTVVEASGSGDLSKVTVEFQFRVRRKFLLKFVAEYLA